jgi:hypothetical protein
MSALIFDLDVIKKDDFRRLKTLVGQKLESVKLDCDDLILEFTGVTVSVLAQYSDAYGCNVFWGFEKKVR